MPSSHCAQHMWPGLDYWDPMFYLACVKVVCACVYFVCHLVRLCTHLTQRNSYRRPLLSVIDEFWWAAAAEGHHVSDHAASIRVILFSRCQWHAVTLF